MAEDFSNLVERIRAGDRNAFAGIVQEFWDTVTRFLWVHGPAECTDDLAQEVFVSLYGALRRARGPTKSDRKSWERYLLRAAKNRLVDHYRLTGRRPSTIGWEQFTEIDMQSGPGGMLVRSDGDPTDNHVMSTERFDAVRECLGRLEPESRGLIWGHYFDGLAIRELARRVSKPEATVRKIFKRAFEELRRCLEPKGILNANR